MENALAQKIISSQKGYREIIKRWLVNLAASLRSLPKRSDVPPDRPHPAD